MKISTIVLVFGLATGGYVLPASGDEAYDQCKAAPSVDSKQCGEAWLARETAALEAAFAAVVEQTDGAIADTMTAEQTAWTEFYKSACAFMADTAFAPGGDAATYFACKARIVADRRVTADAYARYIDN